MTKDNTARIHNMYSCYLILVAATYSNVDVFVFTSTHRRMIAAIEEIKARILNRIRLLENIRG
jgi:hypothetical protein